MDPLHYASYRPGRCEDGACRYHHEERHRQRHWLCIEPAEERRQCSNGTPSILGKLQFWQEVQQDHHPRFRHIDEERRDAHRPRKTRLRVQYPVEDYDRRDARPSSG